jgi:pyrroloquinoline quinone (PQQ) biosynthesis protein C
MIDKDWGVYDGREFLEQLEASLSAPRARFMGNRIIRHALAGTMTRELYIALLRETYHFVKHTPTYILTAAARLEGRDDRLRRRFIKHAQEEIGHDRWALEDLAALGQDPDEVRASIPLPHTSALVAYQLYTIEHVNPKGLLGLEYAMEGSTAQSAGPLVARMKQILDLPDAAVQFFTRHAQVDVHHAEENGRTIVEHVRTLEDRIAVMRNARDSYILYGALYDGICDAMGV